MSALSVDFDAAACGCPLDLVEQDIHERCRYADCDSYDDLDDEAGDDTRRTAR